MRKAFLTSIYLTHEADSAFITGDTTRTPFPVELNDNWKVEWKYQGEKGFKSWPEKNNLSLNGYMPPIIACATRRFRSVQDMPDSFRFSKNNEWNSLKITLNKYFHISAFSKLDDTNNNDPVIKTITNQPIAESFSNYNNFSINYKLLMPGALLGSNGIPKNDTLTWQINAFRLLQKDYIVEATSRQLNIFTTVLSMLIAIAGVIFFIVKRR